MVQVSKTKCTKIKCKHPKDKLTIVVVEAFAMWEVIRVKCTECNQFIDED